MSSPHHLLELRTNRDSTSTSASMLSILDNLSPLQSGLVHTMRGRNQQIAWEIASIDQSTRFGVYLPASQLTYLSSLLASAYPNCLTTSAEYDPVDVLHQRSSQSKHTPSLLQLHPTFHTPLLATEPAQSDSLSPLLSLMAKSNKDTIIVYQFCLKPQQQTSKVARWTKLGWEQVSGAHSGENPVETSHTQPSSLSVTLRMAIWHPDQSLQTATTQAVTALLKGFSAEPSRAVSVQQSWLKGKKWQHLLKREMTKPTFQITSTQASLLYHLPHAVLAQVHNIHWGKLLPGEPPELLPTVTAQRESTPDPVNVLGRTSFKNSVVTFGIKKSDRRRHLYVLGKTGTGKSTLLANMAINDLKQNEGLCVIDPHGDLVETLLDYIPSHRINDVIYFDPADTERTVKLNLFEGEQVVHRELIASGIVSVFHKLYSYSWGPRLEYILRNALLTLLTTPAAQLSDITQLLTDKTYRQSIVAGLQDPILKNFWLNEFEVMSERVKTESVAPILNKVGQFVSSPLVRDVVNTRKSSFSVEQAMDTGKIILVNLSQGRLGEDNATLIGALLITKIQLVAMGRVDRPESDRRDFFLYVDEFQNFATESFVKILSEARKYRLNMILANQYIAQIPLEVQKAIFGNCGNLLNFVLGAEDAQLFSKEYSGLYTEQDLVNLGRYQVITRLTIDNVISSPFPAFTLPLASSKNQRREKVIQNSRERYAR